MAVVMRGLLAAAAVLAVGPARSEVVVSAAGGFIIQHERVISAPPARVYAAIVDEVSVWWNADHTWSGDAGNLSIDARPGGCFCEQLGNAGGVEHMRVVFASPGRLLRLSGGLGPLQAMANAGSMDFALSEAEGDATRLELRYVVSGFAADGMAAMAEPVDGVLSDQVDRLAAHLTTAAP